MVVSCHTVYTNLLNLLLLEFEFVVYLLVYLFIKDKATSHTHSQPVTRPD